MSAFAVSEKPFSLGADILSIYAVAGVGARPSLSVPDPR
jgi:hypothetical protein